MTRKFFLGLGLAVLSACNKPATDDCRKAVANMRSILGTEDPNVSAEPDVRRCKGGSSKEAVACAIKATTKEELAACGLFPTHTGSGSGSAK